MNREVRERKKVEMTAKEGGIWRKRKRRGRKEKMEGKERSKDR